MSVIIRLQNLPWSANALDIRQFFRGLSIPEGGVHIVGGEMGDAFIAFSTDEDARQAMMHDREAINGVQIRLLLSSRAEMQKVIETARQQSLLALKKASGSVLTQPKASPPAAVVSLKVQKSGVPNGPQPPVITASSLQNILSNPATPAAVTPSFLAYQQQAGITLIPESKTSSKINTNDSDDDSLDSRHSRQRRRSVSREHRRSKSRSRERSGFRRRRSSRERSRERSYGRKSSRHRSRSRERGRARSRERSRNNNQESSRRDSRDSANESRLRSMDTDTKPTSNSAAPWSLTNAYQASYNTDETGQSSTIKVSNYQTSFTSLNTGEVKKSLGNSTKSMDSMSSAMTGVSVTPIGTNFQNYNTSSTSLTVLNNYSLSGLLSASNSNDSFKTFALQNPYTTALNASSKPKEIASNTASSSAIPGIFVEQKPNETNSQAAIIDGANSLPQEPIAFANVNPYEQMYPNLFAQAAALSSGQKPGNTKQSSVTDTPKLEETKSKEPDLEETNCIKISNMCARTSYSDLRKFFVGLFIPHNGIKLLNDKHGLRVGIAYVQFSRHSSVAKALCRSNNLLKGRSVIIEAVDEQEFLKAEDSFRPLQDKSHHSHSDNETNESGLYGNNNNSGYSALNPYKKIIQHEPFTVLYIEDIPALATEQDIMKMFSSYSLYDILLIASPENRREFVAHVRFSREDDAKSAYEDRAHHQIGYRRVRIRPGSIEEMESAKEKIRLANEQLMKEEQAAEEAAEEAKRKLEKLITDHITEEEKKQQQNIISMDLTQEDAEDENDDENDVIETTSEDLANNNDDYNDENIQQINEQGNSNNLELAKNDIYSSQSQGNKFNTNLDPRRPQTPGIPNLFELDQMSSSTTQRNQNRNVFNDPRLRNMSERDAATLTGKIMDNQKNNPTISGNNNNFNPNFNNPTSMLNNMEDNFVILKNCDYNTRINDVAQLLLTANLALKHIEPLVNERLLPTGEFIVEFRRTSDAEIAVKRFHNIVFRNRSLRVFPITPQEIADRLGKPFLSYIPGGNGIRITKANILKGNIINAPNNLMNNNTPNMNFNQFRANNPFNDNGILNNDLHNVTGNNNSIARGNQLNNSGNKNNGGIPEKFARPGCVLSLENLPYKAQLSDILNFFQGFDLTPDDIIRRFNDDGSPTGEARVAFMTPEEARAAFESRKRKKLFGRAIFIKTI